MSEHLWVIRLENCVARWAIASGSCRLFERANEWSHCSSRRAEWAYRDDLFLRATRRACYCWRWALRARPNCTRTAANTTNCSSSSRVFSNSATDTRLFRVWYVFDWHTTLAAPASRRSRSLSEIHSNDSSTSLH